MNFFICKPYLMPFLLVNRGHDDSIELSNEDLSCLESESQLSSPIMNFYIRQVLFFWYLCLQEASSKHSRSYIYASSSSKGC